MCDKNFTLNERECKLLTHLLSQLEKRIHLLRISLYGETEKYFPTGITVTREIIEKLKDCFKNTCSISAEDYKLMVDSCEIEEFIRRILREMENVQTFKSLKDAVMELEKEGVTFKKHQKMIKVKQKQIEQLKEMLSREQPQADIPLNTEMEDKMESFCEIDFLKKLMNHKVESRKNFYSYKQGQLKERIEWFERETRLQAHADFQTVSFWLHKYDDYSERLDIMLKEIFDNWAEKRREYEILKKFRGLNLQRIQDLHKLISERDDYIEKYRVKKEKEQKKREEELKKEYAAIKIQAYWRGTMVRKHLGPYKVKKRSKKGKKSTGRKKK